MNYAGSYKEFEIVIVTLIFSDVVPQLKLTLSVLSSTETSLLPYFTLLYIVQFSRCNRFPASFEARSQNPIPWILRSNSKSLFGLLEWARTTDLTIISRTL